MLLLYQEYNNYYIVVMNRLLYIKLSTNDINKSYVINIINIIMINNYYKHGW
jgi:hypothetical protein